METGRNEDILAEILKDGNRRKEAMSLLIKSYQEPLYWHIRRIVISHDDSKDVLQEVFLRTWRNLDQFRGDSGVFPWLYRIASNESLRFLKKKQRRQGQKIEIQDMLVRELETEPLISGDEIQISLQKALLGLTDRQRLVFNLRYFDELEHQEIAKILKTTVNNVKVLYHKAKRQIEEILKEEV
jgi:RNA polymerase sigma factor (sigma-70 family)